MRNIAAIQDRLARFYRWINTDTDSGLLALFGLLRFGAMIGLIFYFSPWLQNNINWGVILALCGFSVYVFIVSTFTLFDPRRLLTNERQLCLVLLEIWFYTFFYYASSNPRSDIYILFLLPLFAAFRYLRLRWALAILGMTVLCFSSALYGLRNFLVAETTSDWLFTPDLSSRFMLWRLLLARNFILLGPTLFQAGLRQFSVLAAVKQRSELALAFDASTAGVFAVDHHQRLVFVNETLRQRHGDIRPNQRCWTYFGCRHHRCAWCTFAKPATQQSTRSAQRESTFTDQAGRDYPASVTSFPLPDKEGQIVGAFSVITDVSRRIVQERRLAEKLERSTSRVRNLTLERARWLETYTDLGQQLAGFDDLLGLMQFVVDQTKARLNVEVSSLFLLDEPEKCLRRRATAGVESDWLADECYQIGEGIVGKTVVPIPGQKYGAPICTDAVDQEPDVEPYYVQKYRAKLPSGQVKHLVTVPLNGQTQSFGVLRVVNKLTVEGALAGQGFIQQDVDFLVAIASMVVIAIENTRLLEDTKRYLREIKSVHEVSQVIASSQQIEDVLQKIVTVAGKVSFSEHTGVVLLNDDGSLIKSVEDHPLEPPLYKRARPDGMTQRVIDSKQPVFVDDIQQQPADHNPLIQAHGFLSYAGLPLVVRDQVRGVLFVHSTLPNAFRQKDDILATFCNHVATALENAELYQRLDERARVRERKRLSEDLHDTMNVLHGTLVLGTAIQQEWLNNGDYASASVNVDKLVKAARHTFANLRRLLADVRDPILRDQGLLPALRNYAEVLANPVHFECSDDWKLPKDLEFAVYRIAQEAINNASKHGNPGGAVQITVALIKRTDEFQLDIIDNGVGFDAAMLAQQEDAFGLESMRHWAQNVNAHFEIYSHPGQGTDVRVWGSI